MRTPLQQVLILMWSGFVVSLERGFVYCPAYPCSCESKDGVLIINCRSRYLSSLPKFLSFEGRIKELSLRHNSITSLPASGFLSLNIEKLDLMENAVTFIHKDAFQGQQDSLRWLSIQLYAMDGFPTLAFSRLRRLRTLIIVGCKLPELRDDLFMNLAQLEELHLIGCRINYIRTDAFRPLPRLNTLVLAKNAVHSKNLPEINQLEKLVNLDLSFNDIHILNSSAFSRLTKLRSLKLWSNKLSYVDKEAFKMLDFSLEDLNLGANKISEQDLCSLSGLKVLRRLDLSFNKISNISGEYFTSLRYLTSLTVSYNRVKAIDRRVFRGLSLVIELILSGNPLQLVESGSFSELRSLGSLNINNTNLGRKLRSSTFEGLSSSLTYLDVSNSSVVSSDLQAVSGLTNLVSIDLSHNKINHLDFKFLRTLRNLNYANFSYNNIHTFPQITASNLSLKTLDFSWNKIQTIDNCAFFALKELGDFRLEGNPLRCNCNLSWLYSWLQMTHSPKNQEHYKWTCSDPPSLKGYYFSQLEFSDFKCSNSSNYENSCPTSDPILWSSGNATESSIFQQEVADICGPICVNISRLQVNLVYVQWLAEDINNIYGFNLVLKRHNDSTELQSEAVLASTTNFTFRLDTSFSDLEVCVAATKKDFLPLAQRCDDVPPFPKTNDDKSREQELHNLIHNSFIPLIFIYICGSLALAFIVACFGICICKHRNSPMRVKPLGVAYPAWLDPRTSSATSTSLTHAPHFLNTLFISDANGHDSRSSLCVCSEDTLRSTPHSPAANSQQDFPMRLSNRRESEIDHRVTDTSGQLSRDMSGPGETSDDFFFHF